MDQLLRRVCCWKFGFYEVFLPVLRTLGPARCDAISALARPDFDGGPAAAQGAAAQCLGEGPGRS